MTVGGSIFLIAVGAILRYAVTDTISGVDLATIGLILMIAGIVGLVIGLFMYTTARRSSYVARDRERHVDREPLG
jgi:heme/copper-type cytochrome/quinol oxidase subunit 2